MSATKDFKAIPSETELETLKRNLTFHPAKPANATAYAKEAARDGLELDLRAGLKLEKDLFVLLMSTGDRKEAAAAFKEKRPPVFTGR